MIHYVQGDLLKSDCDIIAHGCNCFGTMGAGIAKQIAAKYPGVYHVDIEMLSENSKDNRKMMGSYSVFHDLKKDRRVYNLYTQYSYGTNKIQVDYRALKQSFEAMKNDLIVTSMLKNFKIGIPKIGCGLAGGDWAEVSKIIESVFVTKDIYVYVLDKNELEESKRAGHVISKYIEETKKDHLKAEIK